MNKYDKQTLYGRVLQGMLANRNLCPSLDSVETIIEVALEGTAHAATRYEEFFETEVNDGQATTTT